MDTSFNKTPFSDANAKASQQGVITNNDKPVNSANDHAPKLHTSAGTLNNDGTVNLPQY